MHIAEGILQPEILLAGSVLGFSGVAYGLKKMAVEEVPKIAMISCVLFVSSLVHVPVGLTNVHLILNGLAGLLLGWAVVPAIGLALLLQAILFQFGGLTTLGVNIVVMASPAIVVYYMFKYFSYMGNGFFYSVLTFSSGFLAILLGALLLSFTLMSASESFTTIAQLSFGAYLPVMIIEGVITMFIMNFLKKVKPELINLSTKDTLNAE